MFSVCIPYRYTLKVILTKFIQQVGKLVKEMGKGGKILDILLKFCIRITVHVNVYNVDYNVKSKL